MHAHKRTLQLTSFQIRKKYATWYKHHARLSQIEILTQIAETPTER